MLSVHFAFAALRNAAFEVAWVPGYAFRSSRLLTTVNWSRTGASGPRLGESCASFPSPGGVHSAMFEPIGM